jgi:hypothetical protein
VLIIVFVSASTDADNLALSNFCAVFYNRVKQDKERERVKTAKQSERMREAKKRKQKQNKK